LSEAEQSTDFTWPYATTLILAAGTPEQRRWAIGEALELARRLAAEHPKVVVLDLLGGGESVATALDVEAGLGIVDVFFRGASFSSAARRTQYEKFFFLPIGTAPPPREILYKHPGWAKVASRLADASAFLLPCVDADEWLDTGPIVGFESCVVLNGLGVEVPLPDGAILLAEFQPAPEPEVEAPDWVPEAEGVTAEPAAEPFADEVASSPEAVAPEEIEEFEPEPVFTPPSELTPPPGPLGEDRVVHDEAYDEAYPGREVGRAPSVVGPQRAWPRIAAHPGNRLLGPVFAGIAIVLLMFTLWKAWQDGFFVSADITGNANRQAQSQRELLEAASERTSREADEASPGSLGATPVAESGESAVASEVTLGYSVAVASFRSLEEALAHIRARTRPDIGFYVAPTVVRGVVWNRVLAGTLGTREEAEALMETLVRDGVKDEVNSWDIRPTWLAYRMGTYPSVQDARATVATLEGLGIPAYVVPAERAAGQGDAYHVYAGGYDTQAAAQPLADQIARAGLEAELVERLGSPPP